MPIDPSKPFSLTPPATNAPETENPFMRLRQDQRDSVGTQLADLLKSSDITPGQRQNALRVLRMNHLASQAATRGDAPFAPGGTQKQAEAAARAAQPRSSQEQVKDLVAGATGGVLHAVTDGPKTPMEQFFAGTMPPMIATPTITAKRLLFDPQVEELKKPGLAHKAAGLLPVVGPMAAAAGEAIGRGDNVEGALLGLGAVAGARPVAKVTETGLKSTQPALRERAAKLGTKYVNPSLEDRLSGVQRGQPYESGHGLRRVVRAMDSYNKALERVREARLSTGQQMEAVAKSYTGRGFTADLSDLHRIMDSEIAAAENPRTGSAKRTDALKRLRKNYLYEPGTTTPKDLRSLTPSEMFELKKVLQDAAYEGQADVVYGKPVAQQLVTRINEAFAKYVPEMRALAARDSQLITATDGLENRVAGSLADADREWSHSVIKVRGSEGGGTTVHPLSYINPMRWLKGPMSRSTRIWLYNKLGELGVDQNPMAAPRGPGAWPTTGNAPPTGPTYGPMGGPNIQGGSPLSPTAPSALEQEQFVRPKEAPKSATPKTKAQQVQAVRDEIIGHHQTISDANKLLDDPTVPADEKVIIQQRKAISEEAVARLRAEAAHTQAGRGRPLSEGAKALINEALQDPTFKQQYESAMARGDRKGAGKLLKQFRDAKRVREARATGKMAQLVQLNDLFGRLDTIESVVKDPAAMQSTYAEAVVEGEKYAKEYLGQTSEDWKLYESVKDAVEPGTRVEMLRAMVDKAQGKGAAPRTQAAAAKVAPVEKPPVETPKSEPTPEPAPSTKPFEIGADTYVETPEGYGFVDKVYPNGMVDVQLNESGKVKSFKKELLTADPEMQPGRPKQ